MPSSAVAQHKSKDMSPEPELEEDQGEEEVGSEEEYEIEHILDAKHGYFPGGKIGYLVKWKGYAAEHNSWVSEDDAGNAEELIAAYWTKHGKKAGRKSDARSVSAARKARSEETSDGEGISHKKRGRLSKSKPVSDNDEQPQQKPVKKQRKSVVSKPVEDDAMDEDENDTGNMDKWKNLASWQHLVDHIETVERTQDGRLFVYFTLKQGGQLVREDTKICKAKMPQMLLDFYESNLRWRPMDTD